MKGRKGKEPKPYRGKGGNVWNAITLLMCGYSRMEEYAQRRVLEGLVDEVGGSRRGDLAPGWRRNVCADLLVQDI